MTQHSVPRQHVEHGETKDASSSDSDDEDCLWIGRDQRHCGGPPRTWTVPLNPTIRSARSSSAPPAFTTTKRSLPSTNALDGSHSGDMLAAASTVDHSFDDDDWIAPPPTERLYRAASVGNSWGVTSFGRGFDWKDQEDEAQGPSAVDRTQAEPPHMSRDSTLTQGKLARAGRSNGHGPSKQATLGVQTPTTAPAFFTSHPGSYFASSSPLSLSPNPSRPSSPQSISRTASPGAGRPPLSRTPTSPRLGGPARPRRRSSQQRVSLIAGRVSIVPSAPPSPPPEVPQKLVRANSAASFLSVATSTGPPTPSSEVDALNERSISEFVIEREIGRGAYGLVKRAREMQDGGLLGVRRKSCTTCSLRLPLYARSLRWSSSRSSNPVSWLTVGSGIQSMGRSQLKSTSCPPFLLHNTFYPLDDLGTLRACHLNQTAAGSKAR